VTATKDLLAAAEAAARAQGCDCDVEVRMANREERRQLRRQYGEHANLHHAKVMHDDWCSLLARIEGPGNN
jgi:hypothetical protein